jgi:hypothetical protein
MALEKYTVIYAAQASGVGPANWKAGEVSVKNGLVASAGYTAGSGLIVGTPLNAKVVTVEAESAEEAAEALRAFYGQGIVVGKCLAGKTSGLAEVNAIP